jgi:uridine kinase
MGLKHREITMQGDRLIIESHHLVAAERIAAMISARVATHCTPYAISIAGESGSGKSEIAQALADELTRQQLKSIVLQQDDYFVYPPLTNDSRRREDIRRVGPQEVQLDWIDRNISAIVDGMDSIEKPLVFYKDNRIEIEKVDVRGCRIAIAEGTYTFLLRNVDLRLFIDRTYIQTLETRHKRGREAPDPFIERVLKVEHDIIKQHKTGTDIVIAADYSVHEPIRKA